MNPLGRCRSSTIKLLVLVTLLLMTGCLPSDEPELDDFVDIGTHQLFIHCSGSGRPTVVLDTGLGETYDSWELIIDRLDDETRVCAYDRAGYGQSEPGPMPRDAQSEADELHLLLKTIGEEGPYLLVGHSLGALNMQVYANRYSEKVRGLVLLDPTPLAWLRGEGFPELRELFDQESKAMQEAAQAANESSDPEAQAAAARLTALASEFEELFGRTADAVAGITSFDGLPLTVIGATEPDPHFGGSGEAFRQFWNQENQALAEKSTSGHFILAEGSSHQIHLDMPELVIEVILEGLQ